MHPTLDGNDWYEVFPLDYFDFNPSDRFDPARVVADCIESGARAVLLSEEAIPPEFFDLSSGLAGELLHRLGVYKIRLAGVVGDLSFRSDAFRDFVRESNRGAQFRFFSTRSEATDWLEG